MAKREKPSKPFIYVEPHEAETHSLVDVVISGKRFRNCILEAVDIQRDIEPVNVLTCFSPVGFLDHGSITRVRFCTKRGVRVDISVDTRRR